MVLQGLKAGYFRTPWLKVLATLADLFLVVAYLVCRLAWPLCEILPPHRCGLGPEETQICTWAFLAAVLRVRRSAGSWRGMYPKISTFLKLFNVLLFLRLDRRLLVVYLVLLLINYLVLFGLQDSGEAKSDTKSEVLVFTGKQLEAHLSDANETTPLLVTFHASWSQSSQALLTIIQEMSISGRYSCIKFATVEISHDLETARRYGLDNSVTSTDLPTMMLFPSCEADSNSQLRLELGPKALVVQEAYLADHFQL